MIQSNLNIVSKESNLEKWFDDLVAELRSHQVQLETNTASKEMKKIYETVLTGNANQLAHLGKFNAQKHFVTRIIIEYIELLKNKLPLKLAFNFNDSEVLVWAEIDGEDSIKERELLKAEAEINAKYHPFGFDMETTIVEKEDCLPIPNHYQTFKA
jgi:hypothetical protein